ncbi:unnamed protein product [Cuscuta campestris]|uniref:Endonuclease/exonuclease/phosphatase domain-containing protein n=1 Tax=Cuscuta campestris TaxID=132261 RepID=A0A484KXB5_9ASTE|nr:unnamed protein product [Cuscuta campestris]
MAGAVLTFSTEDIRDFAEKYKFGIIGRSARDIPNKKIVESLQRAQFGGFKVSLLRQFQVLINFNREEDYVRFLSRRTWRVEEDRLYLAKWSPSYLRAEDNPETLICVTFKRLPIHLQDVRALFSIASMVGRPIMVDDRTLNAEYLNTARILVDIDLCSTPPTEVKVRIQETVFSFPVEYQNLPKYCGNCKRFGHICKSRTLPVRKLPTGGKLLSGGHTKGSKERWSQVGRKSNANKKRTIVKTKTQIQGEKVQINNGKPTSVSKTRWGEGGPSKLASSSWQVQGIRQEDKVNRSSTDLLAKDPPQTSLRNTPATSPKNFSSEESINLTDLTEDFCKEEHTEDPFFDCLEIPQMEDMRDPISNIFEKGSRDDIWVHTQRYSSGDFMRECLELKAIPEVCMHSETDDQEAFDKSELRSLDIVIPKGGGHALTIPRAERKSKEMPLKLSVQTRGMKAALASAQWTVYGKHTEKERESLRNSMGMHKQAEEMWIIGGDFNVVASLVEHKGKVSPSTKGILEFSECIERCGLNNLEPVGGVFTWTGNRSHGRLWRRLDRALVNNALLAMYDVITLSHLSRAGSDHKPILLSCFNNQFWGPKVFRFQNCWLTHDNFSPLINDFWKTEPNIGGMFGFAAKLKKLKNVLKEWNKTTFGDIFSSINQAELKAQVEQENFENSPTEENRSNSNLAAANLLLASKREVLFWKQKSNITWLKEGHVNNKFYHAYVKGRRAKLRINSVMDENGKKIVNQDEIGDNAVEHFTKLYHSEGKRNLLRFRSILNDFLVASGQEVNYSKSRFYVHSKTRSSKTTETERLLGIKGGVLPFLYLGAQITKGQLRKEDCSHILNHFDKLMNTWYSKTLNPIGRLILIKHVLSSIPLHLISHQELIIALMSIVIEKRFTVSFPKVVAAYCFQVHQAITPGSMFLRLPLIVLA